MGAPVSKSETFAPDSRIGLVADVGGTNARFALAGLTPWGEIATDARRDLRADDYKGLAECIEAYLDSLGDAPRPTQGAFGVASPVTGDAVRLTNRDWSFSIEALRRRFDWEGLQVVNDFAIVGHAVPALGSEHLHVLTGPAWSKTLPPVITLIGPGTGLGVSAVVSGPDGHQVLATEGGHVSFAPVDALEIELLRVMLRRFPRVSNERVLSGPGLANLYAAMAQVRGAPAVLEGAPAILDAALNDADALAKDTVERFALILGGVMGDVALTHGAHAVAMAGGIAPRMIDFLDSAAVRARFEAKGRSEAFLATVPVALITHPEPALLGAARMMFNTCG
jgi:glucokinase